VLILKSQKFVERVYAKYSADDDLKAKATRLVEKDATQTNLIDALKATRPGLVVATSHGMTEPLYDRGKMTEQLGLPVDQRAKRFASGILSKTGSHPAQFGIHMRAAELERTTARRSRSSSKKIYRRDRCWWR
jgi:hypothetical protein